MSHPVEVDVLPQILYNKAVREEKRGSSRASSLERILSLKMNLPFKSTFNDVAYYIFPSWLGKILQTAFINYSLIVHTHLSFEEITTVFNYNF